MAEIKTWRERIESAVYLPRTCTDRDFMQQEINELRAALAEANALLAITTDEPLSDEQIDMLDCLELDNVEYSSAFIDNDSVIKFVRAIEQAHGITAALVP